MTQNEQILEHLEAGHPLTGLEALDLFQTWRLPSRINELRKEGHDIISQKIERNGKWISKYFLYRETK